MKKLSPEVRAALLCAVETAAGIAAAVSLVWLAGWVRVAVPVIAHDDAVARTALAALLNFSILAAGGLLLFWLAGRLIDLRFTLEILAEGAFGGARRRLLEENTRRALHPLGR